MKRNHTPTQIIESTKFPNLESVYIKFPGENPINISMDRTPRRAYHDVPKRIELEEEKRNQNMIKANKKDDPDFPYPKYSTIHTHLKNFWANESTKSFPSAKDLRGFFLRQQEKAAFIANQDKKSGKILGYLVIRKTKKTPSPDGKFEGELMKYEEGIKSCSSLFIRIWASIIKVENDITAPLRKLSSEYNLQYKFISSKNYYFNKNSGKFIQKSISKLELKVAA